MSRVLGLLLALLAVCVAAEPLRLARNERLAEQEVAAHLLREIATRAGVALDITPLPVARASQMVASGQLQGEVARLAAYAANQPRLLRVEPGYYQLRSAVFCRRDRQRAISSVADLQGRSVGIIRGVTHARQLTAGVAQLMEVDDAHQLYTMLEAGRFELAVDTAINGQHLLNLHPFPQLQQLVVLAEQPLFVYLRPEQQALGERLAVTIRSLSASGELARLALQAEQRFLAAGQWPE